MYKVPDREKISVDLRNHGHSPHVDAEEMTYEAMSNDIISVLDNYNIDCACILGHSLGGKVAMQTALMYPKRVSELIVVDIAPIQYAASVHAADASVAAEAMSAVDFRKIETRDDVNKILEKHGVDIVSVRDFLLTNLVRVTDKNSSVRYKWKSNVDGIRKALPYLRGFPQHDNSTFDGKTCLIRGGQSPFVPFQAMRPFTKLFPNTTLTTISEARHWIHAQFPEEFCRSVNRFLTQ